MTSTLPLNTALFKLKKRNQVLVTQACSQFPASVTDRQEQQKGGSRLRSRTAFLINDVSETPFG